MKDAIKKFSSKLGVDFNHDIALSLTISDLDYLIKCRYEDLEDTTEGTKRHDRLVCEVEQLGLIRFYKR